MYISGNGGDMKIEMVELEGLECNVLFANPTGARVNISSDVGPLGTLDSDRKRYMFNATATDVFMSFDGIVRRLYVDIDVPLPSGMRHIWLTDGPAVISKRGEKK